MTTMLLLTSLTPIPFQRTHEIRHSVSSHLRTKGCGSSCEGCAQKRVVEHLDVAGRECGLELVVCHLEAVVARIKRYVVAEHTACRALECIVSGCVHEVVVDAVHTAVEIIVGKHANEHPIKYAVANNIAVRAGLEVNARTKPCTSGEGVVAVNVLNQRALQRVSNKARRKKEANQPG